MQECNKQNSIIYRRKYPEYIESCVDLPEVDIYSERYKNEKERLKQNEVFKQFIAYLISLQQQDIEYSLKYVTDNDLMLKFKGRITAIGQVLDFITDFTNEEKISEGQDDIG